MHKKYIKSVFHRLGYELTKLKPSVEKQEIFKLHQYLRDDGSFDHDEYRRIQADGNRSKLDNVWVLEENISFLSDYIMNTIGAAKFGVCHGTRNGQEQKWFRKYLNCEVIGTEISDTAETFPNTIQWDFHEAKSEWVNSVDFIYSNALDHSYDPEKCLNVWMSCVRKGGICILEHTDAHEECSKLDPFGAHIIQMPYLILTWGKGKYGVRELIQVSAKPASCKYLYFIVIQRF